MAHSHRSRLYWICSLGVLVLAMGVCLRYVMHSSVSKLPVVADADLELGHHWQSGQIEVVLPIRNPTGQQFDFAAIHVSCGCTKLSPTCFQLDPGATQEVRVQLDLEDKDVPPESGPGAKVAYEVRLTPEIEQLDLGQLEWKLHGTFSTHLHGLPRAWELPATAARPGDAAAALAKHEQTWSLRAAVPLKQVTVAASDARVQAQIDLAENGRDIRLHATAEPTVTDAQLVIHSLDASGTALPARTVLIRPREATEDTDSAAENEPTGAAEKPADRIDNQDT